MSYEWKFNKRPYSDDEAKTKLASVVSPETSDWHYNTHHKGYVTALNNIEKGLETADRAAANGNYSQIGELKRRFTWNHAGALLHDVYWEVLGGDGDPSKGPEIKAAIEKEFGSFDAWKADFKAAAVSAKLSGWDLLVFDRLYSGWTYLFLRFSWIVQFNRSFRACELACRGNISRLAPEALASSRRLKPAYARSSG